jgi:hypothetical protein
MILKRESVNVASLEFVLKLEKCTNLQVILFEDTFDLVPHFEWYVLGAKRVGGQKVLRHGCLRGLPQSFDVGEASGSGSGLGGLED